MDKNSTEIFSIIWACYSQIILITHHSKLDQRNAELLEGFPIDGLHYYCDTYDITCRFPSPNTVKKCSHSTTISNLFSYRAEMSWNEWLAQPFARLGLRQWCIVLLQGHICTRIIPELGG